VSPGRERPGWLGTPRLHLRRTDSTNTRARELALRGAPDGTLVTAREQTSGRGRQGRTWTAPPGKALLCSLIIRDPPALLTLAAGVAVAELVGSQAAVKWPNDVLLGGRKVAGILVEGRPQEGWAVLGIGLNVALREQDFPPELRRRAGTLGLGPESIEPTLERLLRSLERWIAVPPSAVVDAVRSRDALLDRSLCWTNGEGRGAGINAEGHLLVATTDGVVALQAGEVHLAAG
jgi:BirA family transcriptional regulator, biotin operon repressor / biotin---[acetyl-CoA-carboxylase] ligase